MTLPTLPPGGTSPITFEAPARGLDSHLMFRSSLRLAFAYSPERPYEVILVISDPARHEVVRWCVSRQVLVLAALYDIAGGDGDFRVQQVQPEYTAPGTGPSLRMRFSSDHPDVPLDERGAFYIDTPIDLIDRGLRQMLRAVPLGHESAYMDMDHQIAMLLQYPAKEL
jgi:hypothetical protein